MRVSAMIGKLTAAAKKEFGLVWPNTRIPLVPLSSG
jgi:hypothetical protein